MKKYLYQFIVALMAILSFTLVSCSDDDDEPASDTGIVSTDANYNLTFNGVKFYNSGSLWTCSGIDEDDNPPIYDKMLSICIYRGFLEDYFMLSIPLEGYALHISLHNGMDLCDEESLMNNDHPLTAIMFCLSIDDPRSISLSSDFYAGYMLKGGSMVVEEYTGERIRLRLTNCKFVDTNDYYNNYNNREIITISGTIDVPLDNEIHKL